MIAAKLFMHWFTQFKLLQPIDLVIPLSNSYSTSKSNKIGTDLFLAKQAGISKNTLVDLLFV